MSKTKKILILGLPQTGKTTFYQKLIKKYALNKVFIPKTSAWVNYTEQSIQFKNNYYSLFDTPAFILHPQNEIEKARHKQFEELIKESDLILWVIDLSQPIDQATEKLNKYLRRFFIPQILILSKADLVEQKEYQISLFQRLGRSYFYPFSASESIKEELIEKITNLVPSQILPEITSESKTKLVVFGPPNSGKSTLLNCLLQKSRSLVSPVAGTTQEPVKDYWNWQNWSFEITDTAGISKSLIQSKQIYWANQKVLRQGDLAWAIIDATFPLTKQTFQIIHLAERYHKPLIILVNKCDLIEARQKKIIEEQIRSRLKSLRYVPIVFLSALEGQGISPLLKILSALLKESQKQSTKKELEETIKSMSIKNPTTHQGHQLKVYFAKHHPGLTHYFILFVNNPQLVHFSYQRYIINYLRKNLTLKYLPIKLVFKKS